MLVPLRHIRSQVGKVRMLTSRQVPGAFSKAVEVSSDDGYIQLVSTIMDLVESFVSGQLFTYGRV
jgi:hypothetical protein